MPSDQSKCQIFSTPFVKLCFFVACWDPGHRFGACAVTDETNKRVLMFGGTLRASPHSLTNDVYSLTLVGLDEITLPEDAPTPSANETTPTGRTSVVVVHRCVRRFGRLICQPVRRTAGLYPFGHPSRWFMCVVPAMLCHTLL